MKRVTCSDTLRVVAAPAEDHAGDPGPRTARILSAATRLDAALTGSLPCVVCGYELKGLSIRGACPECGTAVRATILYKVDPQAEEFRPIPKPRFLAASLVAWSLGGLTAGLACWALRLGDALERVLGWQGSVAWAAWVALGGVAVSWVGAIGLIRPVPGTPPFKIAVASTGAAAYAILLWAMAQILLVVDPLRAVPYLDSPPGFERALLRLAESSSMVVILLGMRPNARDLVKRCMVMRTRRVDRQTLLGMAAVAAGTMIGDGLHVLASRAGADQAELLAVVGTVVIALGSSLLTLGLVGAVVDCWRIAGAVLIPSPSLRQVLGEETPEGAGGG